MNGVYFQKQRADQIDHDLSPVRAADVLYFPPYFADAFEDIFRLFIAQGKYGCGHRGKETEFFKQMALFSYQKCLFKCD